MHGHIKNKEMGDKIAEAIAKALIKLVTHHNS